MSRRWSCVLITTLCCLLALATSASAECAWVLWSYGEDASKWWFTEATPNYQTCIARQNHYRFGLAKYFMDHSRPFTEGEFSISGIDHLGEHISMTWRCLQETMDPAKVKG